jgi:5-formyltetrahydrofolate cyclo-ligase
MAHYESKEAARKAVWDALLETGVARFPLPPHGRIPNFAGVEAAAARLLAHPVFRAVRCIKADPDSPQRPVRLGALERGIVVLVPTPRLRAGFRLFDPARIPKEKLAEAASLSRSARGSAARSKPERRSSRRVCTPGLVAAG